MMRKYLIFDMDGVLLDSEYGAFRHLHETLRRLGADLDFDYLISMIGRRSSYIYDCIIKKYGLDLTAEELHMENHRYGSYYATDESLACMPGLPDFIEAIRSRDIPIAVVSATGADDVLITLDRLDLLKYIRFVIAGNMLPEPKPSPAGYQLAMKYLGCQPEECVIIEDSPIGIQSAKRSGARVIGFKGSKLTQDTSQADMAVNSYAEALDRIAEILEL